MNRKERLMKKLGISTQRRMKNYLLDPLFQVPLSLYVIGLTFMFALLMSLMVYTGLGRLYQVVMDLSDLPEDLSVLISEQILNLASWMIGFVIMYVVTVVVTTVVFTHKMIGPGVAFKRVIRDLIGGRFDSRVYLRKGDAFKELADDINRLADQLEKQSKRTP